MATKWQSPGLGRAQETQVGLSPAKSARRRRQRSCVEEDRMPSTLVRGLDEKTVKRLKARARVNRRSLQQEVKAILERAAGTLTMKEVRRLSERWRTDSAVGLLRQLAIDPRGSRFTMILVPRRLGRIWPLATRPGRRPTSFTTSSMRTRRRPASFWQPLTMTLSSSTPRPSGSEPCRRVAVVVCVSHGRAC
jgi:plasmid stability protein